MEIIYRHALFLIQKQHLSIYILLLSIKDDFSSVVTSGHSSWGIFVFKLEMLPCILCESKDPECQHLPACLPACVLFLSHCQMTSIAVSTTGPEGLRQLHWGGRWSESEEQCRENSRIMTWINDEKFNVAQWAPWHSSPSANWPVLGVFMTQEIRQLCGHCCYYCSLRAVQLHHIDSNKGVWYRSQNSTDTVTVAGLTPLWFLEFLLLLLSTCLVKSRVFIQ